MDPAAERNRLKKTISELLAAQRDDLRLRDHLEGLRRDENLPGLTWFWGPDLYRRNRVVFREFILALFSSIERGGVHGWRSIPWSEHADRLEPWLADARTHRDTTLVRRLFRWKFAGENWRNDDAKWRKALVGEYESARGPAEQARVLEEFEGWFQLDEPTALRLYATNRACSGFLLRHVPTRINFWGQEKREPWRELIQTAHDTGDDELGFALYRRQVGIEEWQRDVNRPAAEVADADRLNAELRKRHPEGWDLKLIDGVIALLRARGRDVFPYVREKLDTIAGGWRAGSSEPLIRFAREREWWDLWAAAIRASNVSKLFNDEVAGLLDDRRIAEDVRGERLRALAGVSREWNWPGVGLAWVHSLDDNIAVRLYERYPELVHGPFKPHVVPRWWQGGPKLLAAAQAAGDEDLVDLLASRYITRAAWPYSGGHAAVDELVKAADRLAGSYQGLRDHGPAAFARRAGNVLTQVPAYAIHAYDHLLRTNALARLLFVRSTAEYLAEPATVRDLVEGSEIHVQMLGYRVLGRNDDRARALAVELLEILLGTLLRPLQRKTRLAAFAALTNAAKGDAAAAARVLKRAREALLLPDTKYPKEELVGLVGTILHLRPELRGPRERPVVYGLEEAAS
jgi:hypothetical protein